MRRKTALKKQEKVFQSRENRTNRCCCCDFLQYRKTPPFLPFSSRCEVNRWHRLLKSYWRLDVKTSWTNLPSSSKRDELNLSNNKQAKRNPHFPQSYRGRGIMEVEWSQKRGEQMTQRCRYPSYPHPPPPPLPHRSLHHRRVVIFGSCGRTWTALRRSSLVRPSDPYPQRHNCNFVAPAAPQNR